MSKRLNFTLLSEGSSDQALLPILTWAMGQHTSGSTSIDGSWVDVARLPRGMISSPRHRLRSAVDVYPCDVLFIHRDEDGSGWDHRLAEIQRWVSEADLSSDIAPVPVIPVRMSEAWLLIDSDAIRAAAGKPHGRAKLALPKAHEIEAVADPKHLLFEVLAVASELSGRKLKKFDKNRARLVVARLISKHERLRQLQAFQKT